MSSSFFFVTLFQVVDLISASQREMGQWSLDYLRTHYVSSSWQVDGAGHADVDNSTLTEVDIKLVLLSNYQVSCVSKSVY